MAETKLLPCPFCGSDRLYIAERNYFGRKFATVNCIECHISQTGDGFETREEAIEQWNTRKPVERIMQQLEDVKSEYEQMANNSFDAKEWQEDIELLAKAEMCEYAIQIVRNGGKE